MPQSCAVGYSNRAEKRAREGRTKLILQIPSKETWLVNIASLKDEFFPTDASRIYSF